ncbi:MAG: glycosyltransferase [Nitrospira sp.]|nr:glycosyltransferase [Nitrospira sp.]
MKLSVVVPVFNEEAVIAAANKRIVSLLEDLTWREMINDYEIIYVDDGSKDNSLSLLRTFSAESQKVKVISFSRNFGHQPAVAAGILHSSGDAVVTLDADLQDPPELIEEMLQKNKMGNDIVYAVRKERSSDTFFKKWTARVFYKIMHIMGLNIVYDHADYRLISRKVVNEFKKIGEVNLFLRGIFPFMGFKHTFVYYDRQKRFAGETGYPLRKMLSFAWEGITSFSSAPLRLASITGFIISLGSVGLIVWALYVRLSGKAIPGWASIVIPLFFIGGLNILFLGLMGEYIGKIYSEVKKRPLFIIQERHNINDDSE